MAIRLPDSRDLSKRRPGTTHHATDTPPHSRCPGGAVYVRRLLLGVSNCGTQASAVGICGRSSSAFRTAGVEIRELRGSRLLPRLPPQPRGQNRDYVEKSPNRKIVRESNRKTHCTTGRLEHHMRGSPIAVRMRGVNCSLSALSFCSPSWQGT